MVAIKIQKADGAFTYVSEGDTEATLVVTDGYDPEDRIIIDIGSEKGFYILQLDESLGKSLVYMTDNYSFAVPYGEAHISYPPSSFGEGRHVLYIRKAMHEEVLQYRNLAENVVDQHGNTTCFPHATANVETRGEAIFAARNAIDGLLANHSHGEWPYTSWGINRRDDACLKLEFGRTVDIDKIVIYERADFPHDNWWKQITISFSDGDKRTFSLVKTDKAQVIKLENTKRIQWLKISELIKSDEDSPFPALTQLQVYGKDVTEEM